MLTIIEGLEQSHQLLYETARQVPGTVQYQIQRYNKTSGWMAEDQGMLHYHYRPGTGQQYLELRFCMSAQMYCRQATDSCSNCKIHQAKNCNEKVETTALFNFLFSPVLLSQLVKSKSGTDTLMEEVLSFSHTSSFTKVIPLCNRTRALLEGLLNHNYTDPLHWPGTYS